LNNNNFNFGFTEAIFGKPLLKYFSEILSIKMVAIEGQLLKNITFVRNQKIPGLFLLKKKKTDENLDN